MLDGLAQRGYGEEQLGEIAALINAEKSDIYDVLPYVAYAYPPHRLSKTSTASFFLDRPTYCPIIQMPWMPTAIEAGKPRGSIVDGFRAERP